MRLHRAGRGRPDRGTRARQYDLALETVQWTLDEDGASLDDVVRRRTFTVAAAEMHRAHGQGPAWFAGSHPATLGCHVAALARPELFVRSR